MPALKSHTQASTVCAAFVLMLAGAWLDLCSATPGAHVNFFGREVLAPNPTKQPPSGLSLEPLLRSAIEQVEQNNPGVQHVQTN